MTEKNALRSLRSIWPEFRLPLLEEAAHALTPRWPERSEWVPAVNVTENPEGFVVTAEVPGLEAEEVHVGLTGELLTLRGEKKVEETKEGENVRVFERHYGAFERSVRLPAPVEAESVAAELSNGVLTVRVHKKVAAKPAKVKVKAV